ncbi:UDP-N-acetylmuramoyl-L-alanyl-D-glutamate--2,6-diaminopimelate ligase [Vibrio genomosp. F10]|uniref:UDP-N-acetylmuramoyl-L-alanyl-D-glutamate--2, 6-diaminopimelate ligase n=1 Tax=Vibrio genomosp. F10 TaxID=723171 RepID=UPI0003021A20|nr:UDP-N-acetylmuramoyl-L-alanyl-D-glutamate--2,6-diaminopimelate ligase [Vibrio genomosp. F10]OEF10319.1 UDP-N-acetylmuramoyl-L-alanyl-D-glutamate--2,6-diaminopimelate ligase [Vibrio genomosp. F10 str. 9ZB36]
MSSEITLGELLQPWIELSDSTLHHLPVTHLELDSRNVSSGDVFVAVKGHQVDGRRYINAAVQQGASCVIAQACELKSHGLIEDISGISVIYINDLDTFLSPLAGRLYSEKPSSLIGVTGTNGKTTITQLIAQWLGLIDQSAVVMGTTGNGFLTDLQPAMNTTGNAIEIQHTLHQFAQKGADYAALEISSHGLVQGRVSALPFSVGVFTNLSRDHLDYHGTMHEYGEAKKTLFTQHQCGTAVINIDDPVGLAWCDEFANAVGVSLSLCSDVKNTVFATDVKYQESGITLTFSGKFGDGSFTAPLIGEFNASNLLLALTTLLSLGFDKQALIETAEHITPVLGRMELFSAAQKAKVVVDYAHTPDALEKALLALKVHCSGKLWAIVGCGGDRDTGKRPMMAKIAETHADHIIFTDDNPRSESPQLIVSDMLAGLDNPDDAYVEHNRYLALQYALSQADENDIVLLAGKGHEDYQVMANEIVHYSDRESALQLLGITS